MDEMKAEIDLMQNKIYIVIDGDMKVIEVPHQGELVLKFVKGKAQKYDKRESHLL
jgi:hypothetical protein